MTQTLSMGSMLSYEAAIVGLLKKGLHVALKEGYVTFDDRSLQAEWIRRSEKAPDVIMLGSSTSMQLQDKHFPGQTFFNHSVRRGVLEDYIAIYQVYRERGLKPQRVIIDVDSWIFDPKHWKQYWLTLRREFFEIASDWRLGIRENEAWECAVQHGLRDLRAIGHKDIWRNLQSLASSYFSSDPLFFGTDQEETLHYLKRADGSVRYHASFKNIPESEVTRVIRDSVRFPRYLIEAKYHQALERFAEQLTGEGVQVAFYLPPHHPEFYRLEHGNSKGHKVEGWSEFVESLEAIDALVKGTAEKLGAHIYGGFRPEAFAARSDEFYDWMHAKESLVKRVLEPKL